jgi:hypothetical protein
VRETTEGRKYLMHIGHSHQWTADRGLAMEYTKIEVAQALADKMGGRIEGV